MSPVPILEPDAVRRGVVIDVAGLPVAVGADDDARAEAVASLFRHATPVADAPRCTLRFVATPIELPDADPDLTSEHLDQWRTVDADTLWLRSRDGVRARGTADELVIGGPGEFPARAFRFVALVGLARLLAEHGRHLLHGAAFAVGDGAVLVLGGSGVGKSTLAYAAHAAGVPVVADDAVILHLGDDADGDAAGVRVTGLARPIAVGAAVAGEVVGGRPVPDDLRSRIELPAGTLAGGTFGVRAVVVMEGPDPGGAALSPLPGPEALRAVLSVDSTLADAAHRPRLFAIAGRLARLPTWSARRGTDPATALADATALVGLITERVVGAP